MNKSIICSLIISLFLVTNLYNINAQEPIPNDYKIPLYQDNKSVYFSENKEIVPGADPNTFRAVPPPSTDKNSLASQGIYFRDDEGEERVFFFDGFAEFKFKVLAKADSETFKNLGCFFSKDKTRAYFHSEVIPGADAKTFQPILMESLRKDFEFEQLGCPYSRDAKTVYYGTKKIPGADPASFKIISIKEAKDKNRSYQFPKDL